MNIEHILPTNSRLSESDIKFIEDHSDDKTKLLLVKYHKALVALEEDYKNQLTWSVEDVYEKLEDINADLRGDGHAEIELTAEEADHVLGLMLRRKDAEQGLSHDHLVQALEDYLEERGGDIEL